ncbi:Transmembrane 9 superfamily member 1 [Asimina triloba]
MAKPPQSDCRKTGVLCLPSSARFLFARGRPFTCSARSLARSSVAMIFTVRSSCLLPILLCFIVFAIPSSASESDHKYQIGDPVTLWVNKVGPYNNPQETYNYFSLPFCHPSDNPSHKWGGLGEVLGGNELIDSQIEVKFQKNVDRSSICQLELDSSKVQQFRDAIENTYWFEFFMGFVGEHHDKSNDNRHLLFTHKNIVIKYNKDQVFIFNIVSEPIIHVNLTQDTLKPLEVGKTIDLIYSVRWIPTNITFARRFDVYLDYPFFEHQWSLSISCDWDKCCPL